MTDETQTTKNTLANYGLIGLSIAAQVAATALFKVGALRAVKDANNTWWGIISTWVNPFFAVGILALVAQTVVWMMVLRRMPLSRAYPFMALVLPANLLVAFSFFSEALKWNHIVGIIIIGLGVICVSPKTRRLQPDTVPS